MGGNLRALQEHNDTVLVEEENPRKAGLVASPASTVKAKLYS
jgi:hypothetical protein